MNRSQSSRPHYAWWLLAAPLFMLWAFAACSSDPAADPPGGSSGSSGAGADGSSGTDGSSSGTDGSSPGTDGGGDPNATEANFKVAFIGDTDTGNDFKSVLQLIKTENATAVFIQGDLAYGSIITAGKASDWFPAIDNVINKTFPGSAATVTIPYFAARGNHDVDWDNYGPGLTTRMAQWGVMADDNTPSLSNYAVVYKGLKVVFAAADETTAPSRADYVEANLANDKHIWKVCSWHKNQRATNVADKGDEMGFAIYENCRKHGAIIAQGHSHTYSRSKTLSDVQSQTVDATCSDPFALCVGAGKTFFFDSSVGGVDTRSINNTYASKPYFAQTNAGSFGALFITFNVGGDPKKAEGYFKSVDGVVVDPPPSSGKTVFTITSSP